MGTLDPTSVTALRSQQLLRIDGARGRRLTVFSGRVWVTQEGDAGDVFLRNGESLRLTRGGRAIVQALSDAKVALVPRSRDALSGGRPHRSALARAGYVLALAAAVVSTVYIALQARTEAWEVVSKTANVALR